MKMALKQQNVFFENILTNFQSCAKLLATSSECPTQPPFPSLSPQNLGFQVLQTSEPWESGSIGIYFSEHVLFWGSKEEFIKNIQQLFPVYVSHFQVRCNNFSLCSKETQTQLQFFVKSV